MKISEGQILEALRLILHPSTGKDIVSMGLVKNIALHSNGTSFELSFISANDPLKSSIKRACDQILKEKFGESFQAEISMKTALNSVAAEESMNILGSVKNIIAIASGKGGVGKSTVAANLALAFGNSGAKVGLIDADIFGPSIPKMFGVENEKPGVIKRDGKDMVVPVQKYGIKILSIGFFINAEDATIWRGPMASNAFKQLLSEADWGELDYLFVDLPPGTSDVHLTLVQTVPVTGAVIVSTPQDVALADVIKGINMFQNQSIRVPVLGLIENMSWFTPEEFPEYKYYIFGKEGCSKLAEKMGIPLLGQIPLIQRIRESSDEGVPIVMTKSPGSEPYKFIAERLRLEIIKRISVLEPTKRVEISRRKFSDLKK
jgi:ATP-binding protein involved in chromosome partitioning